MIGLPAAAPIYLCTEPVDFRKDFDRLIGIVTTLRIEKLLPPRFGREAQSAILAVLNELRGEFADGRLVRDRAEFIEMLRRV